MFSNASTIEPSTSVQKMLIQSLLFAILSISVINCKNLHIEIDKHDNKNESAECALKVLKQVQRIHLIKDLMLVDTDDDFTKCVFQIENIRFTVRSSTSFHNSTAPPEAYFIFARNCGQLGCLIDILDKDRHWNPRAKFTIYIKKSDESLQCVAEVLLINNLFNVNIISKTEGVWKVYSLSSKVDSCNRPVSHELISECSDYNGLISMYNIKNYNSFKGCQIKMVSHNFWPYTTFKSNILGVEQFVHKQLLKYKGINTTFIKFEKDEQFGLIFPNFTFSGMLSLLQRKEVDGALGGYYLNDNRNNVLESTYPYIIDHLIVIVRRAPKLTLWQAVVREFGTACLALTAVFFIIFCIIAIALSLFSGNKRDCMREILTVYCLFLNIAYRVEVSNSIRRIIVANMVWFAFLIVVAVQACLFIAILHPIRDHQIKGVEEVKMLHPVLSFDMMPYQIGQGFAIPCDSTGDCMKQVVDNEGLYSIVANNAYVGEVLAVPDPENTPYDTGIVAGTLLETTMFRRGSPTRDVISAFNGRIYNTGVISAYADYFYEIGKIKNMFQRPKDKEGGIEHFQNVFYLYLAGIILSLVVFAVEFIVKGYSDL